MPINNSTIDKISHVLNRHAYIFCNFDKDKKIISQVLQNGFKVKDAYTHKAQRDVINLAI